MSEHEFDAYLSLLARTLKLSEAQRKHIAGELRDHLEERMAELIEQGLPRDAAILAALDEFGDANVLAHDLTEPRRQQRKRRIMQSSFGTLAAAATVALAVTYLLPVNHQGVSPLPSASAQTHEAEAVTADSSSAGDAFVFQTPATIDLDVTEMPLIEVLDRIRESTGWNMHVMWGRIEAFGVHRDLAVTIALKDVDPELALQLVLDDVGHASESWEYRPAFALRENVWVIAPISQLEKQREEIIRKTFDCTDLLAASPSRERGDADQRLAEFIRQAIGVQANQPFTEGRGVAVYAGIVTVSQPRWIVDDLNVMLQETQRILQQRAEASRSNRRSEDTSYGSSLGGMGGGYGGYGGEYGGGYGGAGAMGRGGYGGGSDGGTSNYGGSYGGEHPAETRSPSRRGADGSDDGANEPGRASRRGTHGE